MSATPRRPLLCTAAILVFFSAVPATATNLIVNPSFEGPGSLLDLGWESFAYTTAPIIDTSSPRTGTQHVKITAGTSTTGSSGIYYGGPDRNRVPAIPGGTYTATVYAKTDTLPFESDNKYGGANIRLFFRDSNGTTIDSSPDDPDSLHTIVGIGAQLTTDYLQFIVLDEVPSNAVDVTVGLYAAHNSQAVYWDDVTLEFTPGPTTPLLELTIDRDTGAMVLDATGTADVPIRGYTITSANGSLDPTKWSTVSGNYDLAGDGSVDSDETWSVTTQTNVELTEYVDGGGTGGVITPAQAAVDISVADDLWVRSPVEDVVINIELDTGQVIPGLVSFTGGDAFERSDLNFDHVIDSGDWPLLRDNLLTDVSSLSSPLAYQEGDLNDDGSVDFVDYGLFKADYDAANGLGAFQSMIAGVPEPSSLFLSAIGAIALSFSCRRKDHRLMRFPCLLFAVLVATSLAPPAATAATNVDFTTFTLDNYPLAMNQSFPAYVTTISSATLDVDSSNPHVFYGSTSILNKRITGTINPGLDDDFIGLALGYATGDTTSTSADFLLLDWKGPGQYSDFEDDYIQFPTQYFHDQTIGYYGNSGLALSRVAGTPTADELWGHVNSTDNSDGGVTELARSTTWGAKRYPYEDILYDIEYTSSQIIVKINGAEEINITGSFPDGKLGLYSLAQTDDPLAPVYSDFRIADLDERLKATVNTVSGTVTLSNSTSDPINLDAYSLQSALSSLESGTWSSLQDQDLSGFEAGSGSGDGWEESLGSDDTKLIEVNLATSSTFAASSSINLGVAYDTAIDAQDVVFTYREPNGLLTTGIVEYVSIVEDADFDDDNDVDMADLMTWQRGFGMTGQTNNNNGDANGDGTVDGSDLSIWKSQLGTGSALSDIQSVPEPNSAILLLLVGFGWGIRLSRA